MHLRLTTLLLAIALTGKAYSQDTAIEPSLVETKIPVPPSQLLPPIVTPSTEKGSPQFRFMSQTQSAAAATIQNTAQATTPLTLFKAPVQMKLLVLSADGTEPGFIAVKYFLDYLALPYDAVVLKNTNFQLPALNDVNSGFYQGIILSTGNLGYNNNGVFSSALDAAGWTLLDNYMRTYGARLVSYYTYPEPRYGMTAVSALSTSAPSPSANLVYTAAAGTIFPYLVRTNPLALTNSYAYLASSTPAAGETTTPLLTLNNQVAAALHTKADGREYMAFNFDNNPYLIHSLALNYGMFNWVTRGVFLGERRLYLMPQSDDYFLSNDLFALSPTACKPPGFIVDPTFDPAAQCPTDRMDSGDVIALVNWQNSWRGKAQTSNFRLAHAFNGYGTTADGGAATIDPLSTWTKIYRTQFYWLNHTWDHENLDCYNPVPNSGICKPVTNAEALAELNQNITLATSFGLPLDKSSMVTPNISGLRNVPFLQAAQTVGIKYLVSDTSQPDWQPAAPNTGVRSPYVPSILYIPRRATNVFYNTKSGNVGANGSLPDEYNYFFGPNGLFRIGGPGGPPFFTTTQTYAQIIDRESDTYLGYILRYEMYPLMFHQANLIRYKGNDSLFSDVMTATFNKLAKITNLPIVTLQQTALGQAMEARMAANAANIKATYVPNQGIQVTGQAAATARITGTCATGCISYGGQSISFVPVTPGTTVTVPMR